MNRDASFPAPAYANVILVLLMLGAVFAYVDMQIFALLASGIKTHFDLSDASVGTLQGAALNLSTAIALIPVGRSEEHTSELQSLMRISYAVFCLKKNNE